MNWTGPLIGLTTFLVIGVFHPLVIKGEYYFGQKVNYAFFLLGAVALTAAFFCSGVYLSSLLAVVGFSSFWSILEVREQRERVRKGWFPSNPRRKEKKQ